MNPDGSAQLQLTDTPGDKKGSWSPRWSPDRQQIAFLADRDGESEVYIMKADGSGIRRLTYVSSDAGGAGGAPDWSPDGSSILFDAPADGNVEIFVIGTGGGRPHRLTHTSGRGKTNVNPKWSRDGELIVYTSDRDRSGSMDTDESDIYVMRANGSSNRRLTHTDGHGRGSWTPVWSPDGAKIAFAANRTEPREAFDIYVMDADGSNIRRLTSDEADAARPYWSPDGREIVFMSTRDGKTNGWRGMEIYVMKADGSNVRRLTTNQYLDGHPAW